MNSEDLNKSLSVVVVAGGKGSRLYPLTKNTPKPLLKLAGEPILGHLLFQLHQLGLTKAYIATYHLSDQIKLGIGLGEKYGIDISFIEEEAPMDTAGALSLLPASETNDYVLLINGDIVCDLPLAGMLSTIKNSSAAGVVAVKEVDIKLPYGIIKESSAGNLESITEKPVVKNLVNAGLYLFTKQSLSKITTKGPISAPELLHKYLKQGLELQTYRIEGFWQDVGDVTTLKKAEDYLLKKLPAHE
jgi:NDP-sugar pyrophosphorylase family protein